MPNKHSEQDILTVQNIDLDCDQVDPETGVSHREYFAVKWDGIPHKIRPGETRPMPRYLAEHYAKHLADHILLRREKEEKKSNLMTNLKEREKVLSQILIGVDEYFIQDESTQELRKQTEATEQPAPKPEPKAPEEPKEEVPARPTKKELIKECETLGIEVDKKDTVDDLMGKIKDQF